MGSPESQTRIEKFLELAIYGLSKKGWMDQELFEKWFSRHFLRYAPPARPLLVMLDGHSSHYSPTAVRMTAEEGVVLFALPPNTTHISQPLDKGVFGPLKVHWLECVGILCHRIQDKLYTDICLFKIVCRSVV